MSQAAISWNVSNGALCTCVSSYHYLSGLLLHDAVQHLDQHDQAEGENKEGDEQQDEPSSQIRKLERFEQVTTRNLDLAIGNIAGGCQGCYGSGKLGGILLADLQKTGVIILCLVQGPAFEDLEGKKD